MGQQQLLLLVLGIVIVGIAIIVGINAYSENSIKSNYDALLQDALRIASDAQAWKGKPEQFGGSPDSLKSTLTDFTRDGSAVVLFTDLGYSGTAITGSGTCYENLNGIYQVSLGTGNLLQIEGQNVGQTNQVWVNVNGTLETNVSIDQTQSYKGGYLVSDGSGPTALTVITCA